MRRASINISLPEELKEYIEEQTKAGEYTERVCR
jgi:Arc/MetJ-type ribon-helix-helix transcriptional regulator